MSLPVDTVNVCNWAMNKRSIEFVEDLSNDILRSPVYKTIVNIVGDENILKYYKVFMVDKISSKLMFFSLAKDLTVNYDDLLIIPDDTDNSFLQKKLFGRCDGLDRYIPRSAYFCNKVRKYWEKILAIVLFVFLPLGYVILRLNKLRLQKKDLVKYDVAMPVVYGFYEDNGIVNGVLTPHKDTYLYCQRIRPGQIIHIFNYWRTTSDIENDFKRVMEKNGMHYIDINSYVFSPRLMLMAAKIQLKILAGFITNFCYLRDKSDYLSCAAAIIYHMVNIHLELENIDYKVEFSCFDYSPIHIIKTIICNKLGKKTVGIQHAASPYDLPHLSFVHFDRYIVYADDFIRQFSPYWNKLRLEKAGRETVDFVLEVLGDAERLVRLKEKMRRIYPVRKYTVVFALCSDVEWISDERWQELYSALGALKGLDIDFNLFLRFRESDAGYMNNFKRISEQDPRIIIDQVNFTNYELMVLSDLFIACNMSFAINEALASRAKVFTFDLHGRTKYVFGDYGNDFIIYKRDDFLRVFRGLENNFEGLDCKWELLRDHCNFYYDGKNLGRIQKAVCDTLSQIKGN